MDVTPLCYLFTATNPLRGDLILCLSLEVLHEVSQDVQQGVYGKSLAVPSPAGDQQLSFNVAIKPIKISLVSGGAGSEPGLGKTWKWWR